VIANRCHHTLRRCVLDQVRVSPRRRCGGAHRGARRSQQRKELAPVHVHVLDLFTLRGKRQKCWPEVHHPCDMWHHSWCDAWANYQKRNADVRVIRLTLARAEVELAHVQPLNTAHHSDQK
jgi:hypothetical protein